jgi:hypothetical protein
LRFDLSTSLAEKLLIDIDPTLDQINAALTKSWILSKVSTILFDPELERIEDAVDQQTVPSRVSSILKHNLSQDKTVTHTEVGWEFAFVR